MLSPVQLASSWSLIYKWQCYVTLSSTGPTSRTVLRFSPRFTSVALSIPSSPAHRVPDAISRDTHVQRLLRKVSARFSSDRLSVVVGKLPTQAHERRSQSQKAAFAFARPDDRSPRDGATCRVPASAWRRDRRALVLVPAGVPTT